MLSCVVAHQVRQVQSANGAVEQRRRSCSQGLFFQIEQLKQLRMIDGNGRIVKLVKQLVKT